MKILFTTIFYNRPKISKLYLLNIQRLRKVKDFNLLVVCSDSASVDLCREFSKDNQIDFIFHENKPLGRKHNFMLERAFREEWDYLIHSGDDDLMSSELFGEYLKEMDLGTELLSPRSLYFTDGKKAITFSTNRPLGAYRMFKREVIEGIGVEYQIGIRSDLRGYKQGVEYWLPKHLAEFIISLDYAGKLGERVNLWQEELNHGLDFSSELKLSEGRVIAKVIDLGKPHVTDFKSNQNIWSMENYAKYSQSVSIEDAYWFLGQEEKDYIKRYLTI